MYFHLNGTNYNYISLFPIIVTDAKMEAWKQYQLYPMYWVSSEGRIKRIYKNGKDKILNPCKAAKGYLWIDLVREPKRVRGLVHVMVAECFIDNPENKPFVDHMNENKSDNRIENL